MTYYVIIPSFEYCYDSIIETHTIVNNRKSYTKIEKKLYMIYNFLKIYALLFINQLISRLCLDALFIVY